MMIVADMDGTLTESRQVIKKHMADLIYKILKKHFFCIISGASYKRIETQVLHLLALSPHLKNLYIVAQSGAEIHDCSGMICKKKMPSVTKKLIKLLIRTIAPLSNSDFFKKYGIKISLENPLIVDKGSQITYSITGMNTDIQIKKLVDPDAVIRKQIVATLKPFLPPTVEVAIGGTTSIDFTPKGVNKRAGVQYLQKHLGIDIKDIVYIGDKCFEGGNDWIGNEYRYHNVQKIEDTFKILEKLK